MTKKVRKINQRTRRKNRRHPAEIVIEIGVLVLVVVLIVSACMQSCTQEQEEKETSTEETSNRPIEIQPSTPVYVPIIDESNATNQTEETTQEVQIPTTESVWEDKLEKFDASITFIEQEYIEEVLDTWKPDRMFFNLTIGSLEMLAQQDQVTEITEEITLLQQRYILSNLTFGDRNVVIGNFDEKYAAFQTLIATIKENLKTGVCISRRLASQDYLGYEAPLQNAMGLVPASYEEMAINLKHLEMNLNIIPEEIMPKADWVEYIQQMQSYGIAAGFHFPHASFEYATLEQIKEVYQPLIDAGVDYIVLSEKIFPFATGTEPATLSQRFIQILRKEMGFEGVIISADMNSEEMQAYLQENAITQPLVEAFCDGCDIVQVAQDYGLAYAALMQGYDEGLITDSRLRNAMARMLKKAYMYKISTELIGY